MSNTHDLAENKPIEEENRQTQPWTVKPLHRQFSAKLAAVLLTIVIALALIFTLFYQQSERSRSLIDGELKPLKQQFEQLQALQKAEHLLNELFTDSGNNFVELQTELIGVNRQLLRLESLNALLYQEWLNANKSASDIVMRIQQNYGRNEQLKQSSIVQLQLIWFSITPIIDKEIVKKALLFKQLQAGNVNDGLTLSRANKHVSATQQLHSLQRLKILLAEALTRFEQLTIHTSMDDFNLLRLGVEQIMELRNDLQTYDKTKAMVEFNRQMDSFEGIVLTQQSALAKWQGYIRLAQSYQLDLKTQNNQLIQILAEPQQTKTVHVPSLINDWLVKFKVHLTQKELSIILLLAIGLSLFVFCYLLWRIRGQIKLTAQQNVVLIHKSIIAENSDDVQPNSVETQQIMQQVKSIAKPAHNEQEFQQLLQQCKAHQQVIDEQAQVLVEYTQNTDQQRLDTDEQVAFHLEGELQRYEYLEDKVLSFIQEQQATLVNKPIKNEVIKTAPFSSLVPVYEQLKQFHLASNIRSENAVLTLADVNLVNEIHAILMSKQAEQKKLSNQLYFSYDDQLLVQAKLDFRLFQQLMYSLIDITLQTCENAQLHLHLQLQDKSAGQQLVRFVVKVKAETIEVLPDLVTLLIDDKATISQKSPLVDIFSILFAKQHGADIIAQVIDGGFQLNFELPLAIASSPLTTKQQEKKLDGIKVMLLSRNEILTDLLGKFIYSTSAQFEVLARLDSFEQQVTAKRLSKHKLDVLIVTSDVAQSNIDLITQQLSGLPTSLQPKLMLLQSEELNFDDFGFYSQTEQLLFKDVFLQNIKELLVGEVSTNQLLSPEQCLQYQCFESELPVILAVDSPQRYQNFQRLLCWLGLKVHVVSHADAQRELWETGLYCILFTEFSEKSLLKMVNKPLVGVAVFSLTDDVPTSENDTYFDDWHFGQLVEQSTLEELSVVLTPWLKHHKSLKNPEISELILSDNLIEGVDEDNYEGVITELVASLAEDNKKAVFDFSQYLQHQGSVELALFMLDDYAQDNHQQLDVLIDAIKARDFDKAKGAIIDLQLNAQILAASDLEKLCSQWSKLFSGNDIPSSLKKLNLLLKETRTALTAIDSYAESI